MNLIYLCLIILIRSMLSGIHFVMYCSMTSLVFHTFASHSLSPGLCTSPARTRRLSLCVQRIPTYLLSYLSGHWVLIQKRGLRGAPHRSQGVQMSENVTNHHFTYYYLIRNKVTESVKGKDTDESDSDVLKPQLIGCLHLKQGHTHVVCTARNDTGLVAKMDE